MVARVFSSQSDFHGEAYGARDGDAFYAGERVCPPRKRAGRGTMGPAALTIVLLAGGGFGVKATKDLWQPIVERQWAAFGPADAGLVDATATAPSPKPEADPPAQAAAPEPHIEVVEVAAPPGAGSGLAVAEPPKATSEAVTQSDLDAGPSGQQESAPAEAESAPLPPPVVNPADKVQTKAMAVGLHPGLSRALLTSMSPADYRNAAVAIRTALVQARDGEVYTWPQKVSRQGAQFEVRFVAGAPRDCRRYVVTVIKNRWSTTAAPLEKCGIGPRVAKD